MKLSLDVAVVPLSESLYQTYIDVGTTAYNQHYLHLWEYNDPSPYIKTSFTHETLSKEYGDNNTALFVIHLKNTPVGILKITKNKALGNFTDDQALLLDKIYMLKEYAGHGLGSQIINFVGTTAKRLRKKIVWLDTMQKGPALQFYLKNGFKIHSETTLKFPATIEKERPMYVPYKIV